MTTIHHLRYLSKHGQTVRPCGADLQKALAHLNLQPGDEVRMQDGQPVAIVVSALGDFDHQRPRSTLEALVKHPRSLVLMRRTRQQGQMQLNFVQSVYADRHVTTPAGHLVYQVLSNAFGELHWVNLDDSYCCVSQDCYADNKEAYHQGSTLHHPIC